MYVIGHNSGHNFCFLVHGYAWNNLTHSTNPHHISGVFFEHTKFHKGDKHRNKKIYLHFKKIHRINAAQLNNLYCRAITNL